MVGAASVAGTLRSSAGVSAAVLTSRILGVVRESLFSAVFGVSALTDAYRVAFQIPNLLRDLFAEGALSSAFVPTFSEALVNGGRERAYRLGNLVLSGVLLVTGALTLLGILRADWVVRLISGGFGGDAGKLGDTIVLARVMMPILTMVSVGAVFMGMLNAQRHFAAPAFAPALFNVTSIGFGVAVMLGKVEPRAGMLIFAAGTTTAGLVQAVCQVPSLWRLGFRLHFRLAGLGSDPGVRRILRLMAPAAVGLAAIQINVFINTQFACALGTGPATLLGNAFRLFYLPIGLFGVALATVTTSRVSEEAARGDRTALIARTTEGARAVWMLAAPSAVGLIVLAEPVVSLLYQHGNFVSANTRALVPIVRAYMLGVLPYSLVKVFAPAFYTIDRPRIPMLASVCAVTANLAFNYLMYQRLGAPGLALGTTIAAGVNLTILRVGFGRVLGSARGEGWDRAAVALVVANGVLALVTGVAWHLCRRFLDVLLARDAHVPGLAALLLFATIGVGFTVYALILRRLGYPGADELLGLPGRIARRFRR